MHALKTALPVLVVCALAGCAADATPSEADADALAGGDAASEPVGTTSEAYTGPVLDTDYPELTGPNIDFGGSVWAFGTPVGPGTLTWRVVDGFYTPRLVGTMHLDNASGMYARMHVSHWDGGGNLISTEHSGTKRASGMGHQSWSIDLTPLTLRQIVEVHVCTELSNDGVSFWQDACKTYLLN
ncbi:MAG TPA: hypothetical protein VFV94_12610 [Polyangiaceae bacterium]|nr:hypothetical protein [Polyangiaceae bacterium]